MIYGNKFMGDPFMNMSLIIEDMQNFGSFELEPIHELSYKPGEKIKKALIWIKDRIIKFFRNAFKFLREKYNILKKKIKEIFKKPNNQSNKNIVQKEAFIEYDYMNYNLFLAHFYEGLDFVNTKVIMIQLQGTKYKSTDENLVDKVKNLRSTMWPESVMNFNPFLNGIDKDITKNTDYQTFKKEFKEAIKEENLKNSGYYKENETLTMKDVEKAIDELEESVDKIKDLEKNIKTNVADPLTKMFDHMITEYKDNEEFTSSLTAQLNGIASDIMDFITFASKTASDFCLKNTEQALGIKKKIENKNWADIKQTSDTFIQMVKNKDIQGIRTRISNAPMLAKGNTRNHINHMIKVAGNLDLFVPDNGRNHHNDESKYKSLKYLSSATVALMTNFSKEKLEDLIRISEYQEEHGIDNDIESQIDSGN